MRVPPISSHRRLAAPRHFVQFAATRPGSYNVPTGTFFMRKLFAQSSRKVEKKGGRREKSRHRNPDKITNRCQYTYGSVAENSKINCTCYRSTRAKHRICSRYKLHRERYVPANIVRIVQYPSMKVTRSVVRTQNAALYTPPTTLLSR